MYNHKTKSQNHYIYTLYTYTYIFYSAYTNIHITNKSYLEEKKLNIETTGLANFSNSVALKFNTDANEG